MGYECQETRSLTVTSKTFSVIIPVHNKRPHIQRSISSVLNQSFSDFELLVIDDASTDGSLEEIQKFRDPRIRLLQRNTPGPGGYAARNLGISEATGKWIAFLDADDEWMPQHLQRMTELAERFPDCQFLSSGWKIVGERGEVYRDGLSGQRRARTSRVITLEEYLKLWISGRIPAWTGVVCLRNGHMARNLFPEGRAERGGDRYGWIVYLAQAKRLAWSPHLGAVWHHEAVNRVGKISNGDPELFSELIDRLSSLLDAECLALLAKVSNRRVWDVWKSNLFRGRGNRFDLAAHLMWKGDIFFCLGRSAISLMPAAVLRLAHDIRRRVWRNC